MRLMVLLLSLLLAGAAGAQTQSQQVPEPSTQQNVKYKIWVEGSVGL